MVTTDAGNVREVREEQPEKARSPMLVSVAGSVSSASEMHSSKALVPMVTRPLGSTHLERELQSRKALSPTEVTPVRLPSRSNLRFLPQPLKVSVSQAEVMCGRSGLQG